MNEQVRDPVPSTFELRSRELLRDSVDAVDMPTRSRLTRARHAALDAAAAARRRPWFFEVRYWSPAAGVAAAVLLGVVLWSGAPVGTPGITASDGQPGLEDLDIVTASDEGSGDALEMLQNDLAFYDFADKAGTSGPAV